MLKRAVGSIVSSCLICLVVTTVDLSAEPTPQQSLLVLSKHDHTLSIVDPATLKVIAKAPVGEDPHEVIASTDGTTAYVSIYGGGTYHKINVIDLVGQKALTDIDTGALGGPHGLTYVGGKLWFTAEGAKAIARYNPTTSNIEWIMGTGQNRTHMIYVTPNEKRIFTTNVASGTVSFIEFETLTPFIPPHRNTRTRNGATAPRRPQPPPPPPQARSGWVETQIPVGPGDEGFDVSPDGHELWTANAGDGTISVIDTATRKVLATVDAKVQGANRLKFAPDGEHVLITTLGGGDLVIYNASTRSEYKRVAIGHGAAGILMEPGGNRAFVACTPDNYVVVIDLKKFEKTGQIDAGGEPDGLAWASRP